MSQEKKYRIIFDRTNCIGAAACVTAYPKRWIITTDGKADLLGAQKKENNEIQELIITQKELELMQEAVKSCPVRVIKITELKKQNKPASFK